MYIDSLFKPHADMKEGINEKTKVKRQWLPG